MTSGARFLWYYHIPDLVLAVSIYLLIARLALALVWRADGGAGPLRALARVTDPVLAGVAAITPRVVPLPLVIVFALVWLVALRLALFIAVTARGIRLTMG
jgi:YggT family protein